MADQDEVLGREVAIAVKLEESGIALRTQSRAVAALDRLVGSLFDMPAAIFEGVAGKKRLRDEIEARLKSAQARMAEEQLTVLPGMGAILINDLLADTARKQSNKSGVAVEAIAAMKELPPPEAPLGSANDETSSGNIDPDWMNQYIRYAEDASSEHLQQVWGRVLAGEVQKAGSFSRHTLRFIAELDKETAENCQHIGRNVIGNWLYKGENWNAGQEFLISVDMQRLGVIEGVGIGPQQNFTVGAEGHTLIKGKSMALIVRGTVGTKITFAAFLLTRMGQEVMSLLNVADEDQTLRQVAGHMQKVGLISVALGQYTEVGGDEVLFPETETVWELEASPPAT